MADPHRSILAAVSVGLILLGCAVPLEPLPNPLSIDQSEYGRMYEASIQILRQRGYGLDRQDYRFGRITTKPVASPTLVEFWKDDNSTKQQAERSTINYERRQIMVTLEPADGPSNGTTSPDAYLLSTEVVVEREEAPRNRLSGSTSGSAIIFPLTSMPLELQQRGIRSHYWRPIGHDRPLEQRLLRAIVRRSVRIPRFDKDAVEASEWISPVSTELDLQ